MAVNLYSASPPYGWANIIGKLFNVQKDINTSRGTTIPTDLLNAITFFETITPNDALNQSFSNTFDQIASYQGSPTGVVSQLQSIAQAFTIAIANNDKVQTDTSFKTAMTYIIAQMISQGKTVNQSAVTITTAAGGSNTGTGALLKTTKRGDGLVHESMLAEAIAGSFSSGGSTASLSLAGQNSASSPLGQDWPLGSAVGGTVPSVDANSTSMLTNGGMESWVSQTNVPDGWIGVVATPGTTILQTTIEQQQIVIAGSPTGGTYTLVWVNQHGKTLYTAPIAWNASNTTVQQALRLLDGLGSVTVAVTSGSPPNQTLLVSFLGQGGALNTMTSISNLTGGSPTITITKPQAGTAQVYNGSYACQFHSNGAELTQISQLLPQSSLNPLTAYAISLWATCDVVPGAGVVTIDLYDGSAVINDAQGNPNSLTFNASSLTTSFQHLSALQAAECAFRLPAVVPAEVYLRIRISTAVTSGRSIFFDNVGLTPFTMIYPGGPLLALFTGNLPWVTNDTFTITTTNNRAGVLREWCERNFNLSSLGLLLPTSGSPNIPDSVVS